MYVVFGFQSLCSGLDSELENAFLEQVLDVLSYLVRYGYYDDIDDVDDCMKPLIQLLDGFSDVPSIGRQGTANRRLECILISLWK